MTKNCPERPPSPAGPNHLLHCPLCPTSFVRCEYFLEHLEGQHQAKLNTPNRKGWSGGSLQVFDFDFKITSDLDVSIILKTLPPARYVLKNILIGDNGKDFRCIEHNVSSELNQNSTARISVRASLLGGGGSKFKIVLFFTDHSNIQLEEHHWMSFSRPFFDLIHQIRQAEINTKTKDKNVKPQRDQIKLPMHYSPDAIRKLFDDKWYLMKLKKVPGDVADSYQLLQELENNRCLTPQNYLKALKLLNSVEDLHVLERVGEARFECRMVYSGPSATFFITVNEFDLAQLSGVIGENDFIVLQPFGSKKETSGVIEGIENGRLHFSVPPWKPLSTKKMYNVFFDKNRTPLRMEQEALSNLPMKTIKDYIFPTEYERNPGHFKV